MSSPSLVYSSSQTTSTLEEIAPQLRSYFDLVTDVVQNTLKSYQAGLIGFSQHSIDGLQKVIQVPLQLLEEASLQHLISLNRDKKELNEALLEAHNNLMREMERRQLSICQLQETTNRQLWDVQITTQSHVNQTLSMMISKIELIISDLNEQVSNGYKNIQKISEHRQGLNQHLFSLEASLKVAKLEQQKKQNLLHQLQEDKSQKNEQNESLLEAIRTQGNVLREEGQHAANTAKKLKEKISQQTDALKESRSRFLQLYQCNPSDPSQLANRLSEFLRDREITTFINLVQSLSYMEFKNALEKIFDDSLNLLSRVFWFHSPYLDPQTEGLSEFLCISRGNLPCLTELLYVICCFSLGPLAFELLEDTEILPQATHNSCQIEDLLRLFEQHKDAIPKFNCNVNSVKEGLQSIINYGRRKAGWSGIDKENSEMHPEEFCKQIGIYISLIQDWPSDDIAGILNQLSAVTVDCGTGITTLIVQKLNEYWRAHIKIPANMSSWKTAGVVALELVRYQLCQELICHLANTRGEINTHRCQRFYKMAHKVSLGIRGMGVIDFDDKYMDKPRAFASTRLDQFKRSFSLKYNVVIVYLKLSEFLESGVLCNRKVSGLPDQFGAYREEIVRFAMNKYPKTWENDAFEWDDECLPIKMKTPFKILLFEKAKFFCRRPFQPRKKFDANSEILIGMDFFNSRMIQDAIDHNPQLTFRNPHTGDTLLHWAVRQSPDMVRSLLTILNPEMRKMCNRGGIFPSHIAAQYASPETLKIVLDYYGNDLLKEGYLNVKFTLAREGSDRLVCFKMMVDKILEVDRAQIKRKFYQGKTPLISLVEYNRLDCFDYFAQVCSEEELQVNETKDGHETALFIAAREGRLECVKKLLSLGAEIEKGNHHKQTPLMIAAEKGRKEVVVLLAKSRANIHAQCNSGNTPLCIAAQEGHTSIIVDLVEKGVSLEKSNYAGKSPLWLAVEHGKQEAVTKLVDLGADLNKVNHENVSPIFIAASKGYAEILMHLLRNGGNPLLVDRYGLLPLAEAAKEGHLNCVKALIPYTPLHEDLKCGIWGGTALDMAAKFGQQECYQELIKFGYQHSTFYNSIPDCDGLH